MSDIFTLVLPPDATVDLAAMEVELRGLDGVDDAGSMTARSIDPAALSMWFQVAGTGLGVVSAALPVVQKIRDLVHKKGVKSAKLKFKGVEIDLDDIEGVDLEKVLAAVDKGTAPQA